VFETNIVVLHDQIPHISLPNPPFLRSRPHSRRHDAKDFSSSLLSLLKQVLLYHKKEEICEMQLFFSEMKKQPFFSFSSDTHHKKSQEFHSEIRIKW
jgi:hypothetical protein